MKSGIIFFVIAYVAWVILTWVPDVQHLIFGVPVALVVAALTGGLFVSRPRLLAQPQRYVYFCFVYLPLFLWECLKANFDVAFRVLSPTLPISPGIVKVKTSLTSDIGLTFLANSITLTPGTMSVDIDEEKKMLYVHWISVKDKDIEAATDVIVARFERILKKIFD